MTNDSSRSPDQEHAIESETSAAGLGGEPSDKNFSLFAKILMRIMLSVYLILQSLPITFFLACGAILTNLGNSTSKADHTYERMMVAVVVLTLIGVVGIWCLVPPQPLPSREDHSSEASFFAVGMRIIMAIWLSVIAAFSVFLVGLYLVASIWFPSAKVMGLGKANSLELVFVIGIPAIIGGLAFAMTLTKLWPRR